MSIETDLVAFLQTVTTKVYPMVIPEKETLPCITYYVSSTDRRYTVDGPSTYPVDFQLTSWATTYAGAKAMHVDVVDLLNGYSGTMGDHHVDPIHFESELDVFEDDTQRWGVTLFLSIWYRSL